MSDEVFGVEDDESHCPAVGVGGVHSDSYGEDGDGECAWCGAVPQKASAFRIITSEEVDDERIPLAYFQAEVADPAVVINSLGVVRLDIHTDEGVVPFEGTLEELMGRPSSVERDYKRDYQCVMGEVHEPPPGFDVIETDRGPLWRHLDDRNGQTYGPEFPCARGNAWRWHFMQARLTTVETEEELARSRT